MNTFFQMIWKDVRQNSPWAALTMLMSAGALVYAVHGFAPDAFSSSQTPLGSQVTMVTRFASAMVGGVLGLLVVVFDSRGDAWAFHVHRPVTRATAFWGKAVAAWLLYALAAGLPIASMIAWLTIPGHVAMPVTLSTALPSLADFFAGAVCVPLGMIVGANPARWYASRGLPIVCMSFVMSSTSFATEFWQSILLTVFLGAIAITATRGVFIAGPSGARLKVSAAAALSVLLFWSMLLIFLFASSMSYQFTRQRLNSFPMFAFLVDGRVVVLPTSPGPFAVTLADGSSDPDLAKIHDEEEFIAFQARSVSMGIYAPVDPRPIQYWQSAREFNLLRMRDAYALWYFLPQSGRFAAYSRTDRRCLGTLGPAGFAPPGTAAADRFVGAPVGGRFDYYEERKLMVFPNAVYEFDPVDRSVRQVFALPDDSTIVASGRWSDGDKRQDARLCLLTTNRVINIDLDGHVIQSIALPVEMHRKISDESQSVRLIHFTKPDRYALAETHDGLQSMLQICDLSADGKPEPMRRYGPINHAPLLPGYRWVPSLTSGVAGPGLLAAAIVRLVWLGQASVPNEHNGPQAAAITASLLLGAMLCAWLARRRGLPRKATIAWVVAGAAMGVFGALVMLCVEPRPPRAGADSVDAATPDGSEVFAPLRGAGK